MTARHDDSGRQKGNGRGGSAPALVIAGAVGLLALPSAVLAFSSRIDVNPSGFAAKQETGDFASGPIDPRLARAIAARSPGAGPLFRFTPAGLAARPDRSVTVVQRIDPETARTIIVRATSSSHLAGTTIPLSVVPTAYSLGIAHGYQGFAPAAQNFAVQGDSHRQELPDLQGFSLVDSSSSGQPSRLAPHIQLGLRDRAGRAPRTLESAGEQTVDVGGSYRLTRNLDVTAGVRYSDDRDRLQPLSDVKQDNQAVYVGTQFHF